MGQVQSDSDEEVELSEIHSLYTAFTKECPSGAPHLHTFHRIFEFLRGRGNFYEDYISIFRPEQDQISLSEFMVGAQKDIWLMDLLKLDVRACSWFRHNWKKKK